MAKDVAREVEAPKVEQAEQVIRCGGHVLVGGLWVIENENESGA